MPCRSFPLCAPARCDQWWNTNRLGAQFLDLPGQRQSALQLRPVHLRCCFIILHLLDLGYRGKLPRRGEQRWNRGVVTAGHAARCGGRTPLRPARQPGGKLHHRWSTAALCALRALIVSARQSLAGLAFVNGLVFAVWAILMAPTIAGAVEEERRPTAFSFFFATMFAVGIVGGWVGGKLPLWMHGKQPALLLAAALTGFAIWPAWYLRPAPPAPEGARIYPRDPFLFRYLVPFALWNLATGSFNPFFNSYFARLRFPVERIGLIFSGSQMTQVGRCAAGAAGVSPRGSW